MKWFAIFAVALTGVLALAAADPALARTKQHHAKVKPACEDRYVTFSWDFIWTLRPDPQPNGCAPAVHDAGRYLGQDPDPNIRHQLRRDPEEYYTTR